MESGYYWVAVFLLGKWKIYTDLMHNSGFTKQNCTLNRIQWQTQQEQYRMEKKKNEVCPVCPAEFTLTRAMFYIYCFQQACNYVQSEEKQ